MKSILFSSVLLLLFVGFTSIAPPKFKYSSSEGKISVTFPAEFSVSQNEDTDVKTVKIQSQSDEMVFFVSYTIHANVLTDHEGLAKESLDSFNEALGGEISEESVWKVNGQNGLQARLNIPTNELTGIYKVVLIDQMQYQVTAVGPKSNWDEKKAQKFLKSFKVSK